MTHKLIKTDNYLLVFDDSKARVEYYLYGIDDIISHLPLNGSPVLEGVDLLPPIEDDVEQMADLHVLELDWDTDDYEKNCGRMSFKAGYNKASEKYKYTEEDVKKAITMARELEDWWNFVWEHDYDTIIQCLSQYPTEFVCESQDKYVLVNGGETRIFERKTTTNAQGKRMWVGKYR